MKRKIVALLFLLFSATLFAEELNSVWGIKLGSTKDEVKKALDLKDKQEGLKYFENSNSSNVAAYLDRNGYQSLCNVIYRYNERFSLIYTYTTTTYGGLECNQSLFLFYNDVLYSIVVKVVDKEDTMKPVELTAKIWEKFNLDGTSKRNNRGHVQAILKDSASNQITFAIHPKHGEACIHISQPESVINKILSDDDAKTKLEQEKAKQERDKAILKGLDDL